MQQDEILNNRWQHKEYSTAFVKKTNHIVCEMIYFFIKHQNINSCSVTQAFTPMVGSQTCFRSSYHDELGGVQSNVQGVECFSGWISVFCGMGQGLGFGLGLGRGYRRSWSRFSSTPWNFGSTANLHFTEERPVREDTNPCLHPTVKDNCLFLVPACVKGFIKSDVQCCNFLYGLQDVILCTCVCVRVFSDCREILLPLMTDQLKFHLEQHEELEACCQLLSNILEVLYRSDVVCNSALFSLNPQHRGQRRSYTREHKRTVTHCCHSDSLLHSAVVSLHLITQCPLLHHRNR